MLNRALLILPAIVFCVTGIGIAQDALWEKGGPKHIYIKPKKKPVRHMPHDEELKCVDCHKWNGVDAYTSATMTLKKSEMGRLPRDRIRASIIDALKGAGNYREMYVLSTSFDNEPLGTCMEFTLDPQTLALYASSEKQTEKLFHIAANPSVCLVYVRHRDDYQYFVDPLGVQIAGKAVQLKAGDPEFEKALNVCLDSVHLPPGVELTPEMLKNIRNNQLITKVVPERIVITDHRFRTEGMHLKQIWEKQ